MIKHISQVLQRNIASHSCQYTLNDYLLKRPFPLLTYRRQIYFSHLSNKGNREYQSQLRVHRYYKQNAKKTKAKGLYNRIAQAVKNHFITILLTTIIGVGLKAEYENGIIGPILLDFMHRQQKNYLLKKGKQAIQQVMNSIISQEKLQQFSYELREQSNLAYQIYYSSEHNVIQYIQAFTGSTLAIFLKNFFAQRIKLVQNNRMSRSYERSKSSYYNQKEGELGQKDYSEEMVMDLINSTQFYFSRVDQLNERCAKLYFHDLKVLNQGSTSTTFKWRQLQKLHNVLAYLIQKGKQDKEKILIINNIQLLSQSFKTVQIDKINEIFKQIMYLSQQNIARVILISSNHCFYDNYLRKLQSINFLDFKRITFRQPSQEDLQTAIKARMGYRYAAQEMKSNLDLIIKKILDGNDSLRQIMSIIKMINLDVQANYKKYLMRQNREHSTQQLNHFINCQQYKRLNKNIESILKNIQNEHDKRFSNNYQHLLKSIGMIAYKDIDPRDVERNKLIRMHKIEILNDIYKGKYNNQQAKSAFYLQYDDVKQQAFRQLNDDEVLYGLNFAAKSKIIAYEKALQRHALFLSMKWYWRMIRCFNSIQLHRLISLTNY